MKLRPFELVLVIVFGTLFILALILLRTYSAEETEVTTSIGDGVTVWGVLPSEVFDTVLQAKAQTDSGFSRVSYRYVPPEDFDRIFLDALADQKAPDLILLPHDKLVKNRNRLQAIPYESYPIRDFRNSYIDGAEIFALSDGVYGLPIGVDPLVMYWNRDIFSNKNIIVPPSTWEGLVNEVVPALTERDYSRNIKRAAVAMGEYQNIKNALPILSSLMLQGGSAMVVDASSQYNIKLDQTANNSPARPFENAVTFFTNFSNVSNSLYSWNRSLPLDRDMFLSEDLAVYFGFASEGRVLEEKNPNLNFDVAEIPQGATATMKRTYGLFYALAIPRAAANKNGAYTVMQELTSEANVKQITDGYNLAPVSRTLLAQGSNDIYGRVSYLSASNARGWLNPEPKALGDILTKMLEDISSNRSDTKSSIEDTLKKIEYIY